VSACLGVVALQWVAVVPRVVFLVAVAVVVVGADMLGKSLRLPQNGRAVPVTIISQGPVSGPLQFGFEMGTGLRTYMTSGAPHVLFVALVLFADPVAGLLAGLGFRAGRAAMTLARGRYREPREWDVVFGNQRRIVAVQCGLSVLILVAAVVAGPFRLS
jgi:hypothetical protein